MISSRFSFVELKVLLFLKKLFAFVMPIPCLSVHALGRGGNLTYLIFLISFAGRWRGLVVSAPES